MKMRGHPAQFFIAAIFIIFPLGLIANSPSLNDGAGILTSNVIEQWASRLQSQVNGIIEDHLASVEDVVHDGGGLALVVDEEGNHVQHNAQSSTTETLNVGSDLALTVDDETSNDNQAVRFAFNGDTPLKGTTLVFHQKNGDQWDCSLEFSGAGQSDVAAMLGDDKINQKVAQQILAKAGGALSHCHMVA